MIHQDLSPESLEFTREYARTSQAIIVGVALLITVLCAALGAFKFASKCSFSFAPSSSLECYDAYVAVGARCIPVSIME